MLLGKSSLLAEVSHDESKMRERRVSLLSLIFASSWETSASREGKSRTIHLTLIESALLKMWLKVERPLLQFMNPNLLRTKRNENWTFSWGFPYSLTIWLVYVIVWWPDQGPTTQKLLWNVIYNFGFKFQPVDPVLLRRVHQKLNFLTHLIAYAWIQNISK